MRSIMSFKIKGFRVFKSSKSGYYYIELKRGQQRSLGTKNKREAQDLAKEIIARYLEKTLIQLHQGGNITLTQFKEEYINDPDREGLSPDTLRADKNALRRLGDAVGHNTPVSLFGSKVGDAKISEFKKNCKARGVQPVSVNTYLRHIKAAFNYALGKEYLKRLPKLKKVPEGERLPKIVDLKDINTILKFAKEHNPEMYRIIEFALWTGCRRAEIIQLDWRDVDYKVARIVGKGNKERYVPLAGQVWGFLGEKKDIGPVFRYKSGSTISNYFREIVRACRVKTTFHALRHTAATRMLSCGITLPMVQEILGHCEIRTTQIYAKVLIEDLTNEIEKLEY